MKNKIKNEIIKVVLKHYHETALKEDDQSK